MVVSRKLQAEGRARCSSEGPTKDDEEWTAITFEAGLFWTGGTLYSKQIYSTLREVHILHRK